MDIGLKAELKAEVPPASAGRTLDAITDLFRPLSEWAGLKGDQIRLQREDVLFEIARRQAKRQAMFDGQEQVQLKFLIPFLERASVEQPGSYLIDWWADLLSSARIAKRHQQPIFIDFIGKLTAEDAVVLDRLWGNGANFTLPMPDPFLFFSNYVRSQIASGEKEILKKVEIYEANIRVIVQNLRNEAAKQGIVVLRAKFPSQKYGDGEIDFHPSIPELLSLHRCATIGILKEITVNFDFSTPFIGNSDFVCEMICFSSVGTEFMTVCHLQNV